MGAEDQTPNLRLDRARAISEALVSDENDVE